MKLPSRPTCRSGATAASAQCFTAGYSVNPALSTRSGDLPIRYIKTGRSVSYLVDDIVAAAQKVIAEALPLTPPQRPRKKRIRRAVAQPPAAERQRQPVTQLEPNPEPASS
jgi:hypothetical protein